MIESFTVAYTHKNCYYLSLISLNKIGSPSAGQTGIFRSFKYVSSCIFDGCITSSFPSCPSSYLSQLYCSHCSRSKIDYYDIQGAKKRWSWQLAHQRKRSRCLSRRSELALRSSPDKCRVRSSHFDTLWGSSWFRSMSPTAEWALGTRWNVVRSHN